MKTVFVSGSRKISRLSQDTRKRLENMIKQELNVLIGDANGSDKAIQTFFAEREYPHVTIYCAGDACRNNVGAWSVQAVEVDKNLSGRAFYTVKDKEMARVADCGMVLWDGKSAGSMNNVLEMASQQKPVVVYFSPTKEFINVKKLDDARTLLSRCDEGDIADIAKKSSITSFIGTTGHLHQQRALGI